MLTTPGFTDFECSTDFHGISGDRARQYIYPLGGIVHYQAAPNYNKRNIRRQIGFHNEGPKPQQIGFPIVGPNSDKLAFTTWGQNSNKLAPNVGHDFLTLPILVGARLLNVANINNHQITDMWDSFYQQHDNSTQTGTRR